MSEIIFDNEFTCVCMQVYLCTCRMAVILRLIVYLTLSSSAKIHLHDYLQKHFAMHYPFGSWDQTDGSWYDGYNAYHQIIKTAMCSSVTFVLVKLKKFPFTSFRVGTFSKAQSRVRGANFIVVYTNMCNHYLLVQRANFAANIFSYSLLHLIIRILLVGLCRIEFANNPCNWCQLVVLSNKNVSLYLNP